MKNNIIAKYLTLMEMKGTMEDAVVSDFNKFKISLR